MQIVPTILTANIKRAEEKLQKFKGIFEWIQLDIMDGMFVNNKTLLPRQFADLDILSSFKVDVHLMVDNPVTFLPDCQRMTSAARGRAGFPAGESSVFSCPAKGRGSKIKAARVIGQIEMMPNQTEFIQKTNQLGIRPGLAVDLHTPLDKVDKGLLPQLDTVLLMSVKAGFGGQRFQPKVLEKVKDLVKIKKKEKLDFKIALDGGIKPENIKSAYQAGVEIFYVGSFLERNPVEKLEELKKALL